MVDNPRAFPVETPLSSQAQRGMTLRDYFAAAVLPAIYTDSQEGSLKAHMAIEAYTVADAMLAEREKGG